MKGKNPVIPISTLMALVAQGPGAVVPMVLQTAPNAARAIVLARLGSLMAQAGADLALLATDATVSAISGGADVTENTSLRLGLVVNDITDLADVIRNTVQSFVTMEDLSAAFRGRGEE